MAKQFFPFDKDLSGEKKAFKIDLAIGMNIICEDGIPRRVVEIVHSMRWPWKSIINEKDEDSHAGHFVNNLSLTKQILGQPLPTEEEIRAFETMAKIRFRIGDDGEPLPQPKTKFWNRFGRQIN